MEDYKRSMAKVLIDPNTLSQVKELFNSEKKITPVSNSDSSYRLYKTEVNTINLEALCSIDEQQGSSIKRITYFKPIGYYSNELDVYVINEYASYVGSEVNQIKLSINGIIAAFSVEAYIQAKKRKDSFLTLNGLDIELILTVDRDIQIYLDDKYNLGSAIGTYDFKNGELLGYTHTVALDKDFHTAKQLELLSLFKMI